MPWTWRLKIFFQNTKKYCITPSHFDAGYHPSQVICHRNGVVVKGDEDKRRISWWKTNSPWKTDGVYKFWIHSSAIRRPCHRRCISGSQHSIFPIGGHNPISFRNFRTYNLSNDIEFWSRFFFNPQENLYANNNIFWENWLELVRTREELGKKIRTKNNVFS